MMLFPRAVFLAIGIAASAQFWNVPPSRAQDAPAPLHVQGDALEELERKADELSDTARRTIQEFIDLVGPMLTRLSRLIDGLPSYEAPEILPNGDIIIRRTPRTPGDTTEDGLTET